MSNPTHFEIAGKDASKLQRFYRDAFGWQMVPAGPSYTMAHPGNEHGISGGVGSAPEGGLGSGVTVYVEVADLEASLAYVERLGGKRITDPVSVPSGPSFALFADPEGHVIGLAIPRQAAAR